MSPFASPFATNLPAYSLREPAVFAFVLIPLALAVIFIWSVGIAWRRAGAPHAGVRRARALALAGVALWMIATWRLARSGVLLEWEATPPPFVVLFLSIVAIGVGVAFSTIGARLARLPLAALVGVQAFRLPLELAMHRMAERGVMPEQMSYTGRNFDIATGATAIVVALLIATGRAGRSLATIWNVMGFALLANVVIVALISTPRFQYFGPEHVNIWVMLPPFVWLPAVMVLAAFIGHLVIFRALRA